MDSKIVELLAQISAANKPGFWQGSVADARNRPMLMDALFGPAPAVPFEDVIIASTQGHSLRMRMYVPNNQPNGLIVYMHGGGWVLGSVESFHPLTATLAQRSGYAVLSVDYRLAPEHPFPLPLDDARASLTWASQDGVTMANTVGRPLIVMGDSAGANLATTAARLHNSGGDLPAVQLQILAYPVTDCSFDRPSYHAFSEGYLLTRRDMMWFWDQYVPNESLRVDPLASPLRGHDLSASPKALILTAEFDPLRDEGEEYCTRLKGSGVATEVVRCEGLVHGFLAMINYAPSAERAFGKVLRAVELAALDTAAP